jgi:YidC/Oxa1 family membrane protein insertase
VNKTEQTNFMDPRTLIAIFLVGVVFIGWQIYEQHKYPEYYAQKTEKGVAPVKGTPVKQVPPGQDAAANPTAPEVSPQAASVKPTGAPETLEHFTSSTLEFDISSKGMGLRNVRILKYKNRSNEIVELGHPDEGILPFETRLLNHTEALDFKIEKKSDTLYVGRAKVGGVTINKTVEVSADKYDLGVKINAEGHDPAFKGLTTTLIEDVKPLAPGLALLQTQRQKQEFYIDTTDAKDRVIFAKDDVKKEWKKVHIASVGSQYFTQAILDKSSIIPNASAHLDHSGKAADVLLMYPVIDPTANFDLAYTAFVGPKSMTILREVDESLVRVVDFGFFSWIGRWILDILRAFYGVTGNWGFAIILLTLLARLLVLPVNIYSFKSMRAMQAIQPQLKAAREKYKDDQQKQQQEVLGLMRSNKVNPVSGCLPMLLQLPIFWALYQVLGNSIELYQAPFGLWIHDLSLKDPIYILPVLMGGTMFVQQKVTPTTMDPAQAKMMLMMPLLFTFFMIQLPSGLTLYMLVSSVFSVVQQSYFMKQPKTLSSGSKA